jgi:hypothetical protein
MAGMKKKATPSGARKIADKDFYKSTGVGKTAQASRGMNIYAKENIPKGYTVQKVKLSGGKSIALVGRTTNVGLAKTLTSQASGYRNPNAPGNKKTVAPTARTKKNPFKRTRSK